MDQIKQEKMTYFPLTSRDSKLRSLGPEPGALTNELCRFHESFKEFVVELSYVVRLIKNFGNCFLVVAQPSLSQS